MANKFTESLLKDIKSVRQGRIEKSESDQGFDDLEVMVETYKDGDSTEDIERKLAEVKMRYFAQKVRSRYYDSKKV